MDKLDLETQVMKARGRVLFFRESVSSGGFRNLGSIEETRADSIENALAMDLEEVSEIIQTLWGEYWELAKGGK